MCEKLFMQTKEYILNLIKKNNYPEDHPFLEKSFEKDQVLQILTLLKIFFHGKNENIIEEYISGKLKAHNNGIFAYDKFHQVLCEITFLWYIIAGLTQNNRFDIINTFTYEPILDNGKKLEYSFKDSKNDITINFEVKNITCDPFLREPNTDFKVGDKFIKPYFTDNLDCINESIENYTILSSQYKQIKGALKKIRDKFTFNEKELNIGVVVYQFAPSYEEIISYFMNPSNGYLFKDKRILKDFDAIIFFSMTPAPDLYMKDVYESDHVFSMLTSTRINPDLLKDFRLDNVYATSDGKIFDEIIPFAQETYGKYVLENYNGILHFFREDIPQEETKAFCSKIKNKLNNSSSTK